MKKYIFVLLIIAFPSLVYSENIYVSQSGTGDGTSCSSPRSATWFNTSANWGGGAGEIDPGDTVYFCGTITTDLTVQASGTSGNNIVFDGTNATLDCKFIAGGTDAAPGTPRQYLTFQNATFASGRSGDFSCMGFFGSSYLTISNVTAQNATGDYPLTMTYGSYITVDQLNLDGMMRNGIRVNMAHHITLSRLHVETWVGPSDWSSDIIGSYGGHTITLEKSYLNQRKNDTDVYKKSDIWETACPESEVQYTCTTGNEPHDMIARHNLLVTDKSGYNVTRGHLAWIDTKGYNAIYGNVLVYRGANYYGTFLIFPNSRGDFTVDIYNNTFAVIDACPTWGIMAYPAVGASSATINFTNNILYAPCTGGLAFRTMAYQDGPDGSLPINHSYNTYNGFTTNGYNGQTCADFISGHPGEVCNTNPLFYNPTTDDYRTGTNSAAFNTGMDLGATYNLGLSTSSTTFPDPVLITRPQSTAWDKGAYEFTSGADTTPPVISSRSPAPGATGILITARNVSFVMSDDVAVDRSTMLFNVNGETNCSWNGSSFTCPAPRTFSCTPSTPEDTTPLTCTYNRGADWDYSTLYTANVDVYDTSANRQTTNWSFTTQTLVDTQAPTMVAGTQSPAPGATGWVTTDRNISFDIEDNIQLVDTSIQFRVGTGGAVNTCGSGLTCSWVGVGNKRIHASYVNGSDWAYSTPYTLYILQARDTSNNNLTTNWTFTTEGPPQPPKPPTDIEIHVESP